jgi:spore germination protein GerM
VLLAGALLALALGGCGVPIGGAHALARSAIPSSLLQRQLPPASTTPTTSPPSGNYVPATIYWVGPDHSTLVPAQRVVPANAPLRWALFYLTIGPLPSETALGDTSALDSSVRLVGNPTLSAQVVTVDFNSSFGQISGPGQVLAVAQVVYTVAEVEGCLGVAFEIDGTPAAVPIGSGAETFGPVDQADYAAQAPPGWSCPSPPTPTSTTTTRPAGG